MRKYSVLMTLGLLSMLLLEVYISASQTTTVPIEAEVNIRPVVFNLKQRGVVTAYISNLTKDGYSYDVHEINVSTVRLFVAGPLHSTFVDDTLIVKFDAVTVADYIWSIVCHMGAIPPREKESMELTVSGKLLDTGERFEGSDTIEIFHEFPLDS